jgi:hypothetical protein
MSTAKNRGVEPSRVTADGAQRNEPWSFRIPQAPSQRLACSFCDGTGHRCLICDGDGWLLAEDAPERQSNPQAEIYDAR